ncbi:dihydropteroate synthase [Pasteurellaceae bacterium HPA106]|uniref:dihydropteroate synthase n=1 Tax=Spirabiliibacterium pneumoniae TaxID=221400 RepID=UPI001AADA206|nr:dihydropteroate synthase [Spirabiliibacterium pneumoniae]MBE2895612.1 dihydropteroate synthase [Spirabiliibacterium pneumoniae]
MLLQANNRTLDLHQVQIMGILNVTPDSFSDSGQFYDFDRAFRHVEAMLNAGASIIDIGGESTRPGAADVSVEEEIARVVPLVEAVRTRFDCWISVDTSKAQVMREAAKVGMDLINDVRALQAPEALQSAVDLNLPVCIMHMQGQPRTMQQNPHYDNVVREVCDYLNQRAQDCMAAGIRRENLILDPGFGFGKTTEHNYQLLQQLDTLCALGYPVLAGLSRKSMIGNVLHNDITDRDLGSAVASLLCAMKGARILRVHNVKAMAQALTIWQATQDPARAKS